MNLKCFILGHVPEADATYSVEDCHNCGCRMWTYGHMEKTPFSLSLAARFYTLASGWHYHGMKLSHRCNYCGKYDRLLRWKIGRHELCDDIPF